MPRKPRVCGITHCNNTHWGNIDTLCADCFGGLRKRVVNEGGHEKGLSTEELHVYTKHIEKQKSKYCKGCLKITVQYKDALCYRCTSNLNRKRDAEDISSEDIDLLTTSENIKASFFIIYISS
mmetsp:Transcript_3954/g.4621  ORF Transcript_3954/g.4621 Transcript_3954/m.4621 type:complete len:123 (+) Transcript_3954:274-642(+)